VQTNAREITKYQAQLIILTLPWSPFLVATKGSSATSSPKTLSIPADTIHELQN